MSPRDEESVERYVRYPQSLSAADRERVELLLRTDATARRLAAYYRGFYDELDSGAAGGDASDGPADGGRGA